MNYGYGYGGHGYEGGYWQGNHLYYNRAVVNVGSVHITNVYNKTVINNVNVTRVSYNGGSGGVRAQPTAEESAAVHEHHVAVTPAQQQHVQAARSNPELRASTNRGNPPIAATARPANFSGPGVVPAKHAETSRDARESRLACGRAAPSDAPRPRQNLVQPCSPGHLGTRAVAPAQAAAPREHVSQPRPPAAVESHPKPEQTQPSQTATATAFTTAPTTAAAASR